MKAGLKAALVRGHKGGRRSTFQDDHMQAVLTLLRDPQISVRKATERLRLGFSSLHRHALSLRA